MTVKLLLDWHLEFLSLKGGLTGSSESIRVKMSYCCKFHVLSQMSLLVCVEALRSSVILGHPTLYWTSLAKR